MRRALVSSRSSTRSNPVLKHPRPTRLYRPVFSRPSPLSGHRPRIAPIAKTLLRYRHFLLPRLWWMTAPVGRGVGGRRPRMSRPLCPCRWLLQVGVAVPVPGPSRCRRIPGLLLVSSPLSPLSLLNLLSLFGRRLRLSLLRPSLLRPSLLRPSLLRPSLLRMGGSRWCRGGVIVLFRVLRPGVAVRMRFRRLLCRCVLCRVRMG